MQKIHVKSGARFDDYMAYASLIPSVKEFLKNAEEPTRKLKGCKIWMINSTAIGGGVAEMLPSQMRLIRELGISIEWLVIQASDPKFFDLTKRIHNGLHGSGKGEFNEEDRKVYEEANEQNLDKALHHIKDGDLVVIHDPQPMPLASLIKKERNVKIFWRCHIGLEKQNEVSSATWSFLSSYFDSYDHFVFSLASYVPSQLNGKTSIITPAIDPLSHKNRKLQMHKCIGILHQSGIINEREPVIYPFYQNQVRRILPDGSFGEVNQNSNLDLIYRPTITQISRWDRLKGFKELMDAFILLKKENKESGDPTKLPTKRIEKTRLILGGPDPKYVSDDPEGKAVLEELKELYTKVDPSLHDDIAILLLPLDNPKENALIVNAIQYSSSIIVQNSIQEGFGLTATEAMWKQRPVLVSGAAGLDHQVVHNVNGKVNKDPTDIKRLANTLDNMLNHPKERDKWGFNAQIRVIEKFTLFGQIGKWLDLFATKRYE